MTMTKRGFAYGVHAPMPGYVTFIASAVGAGASALTISATSVVPAQDNFFQSCVFSSTGLFVVTLKEMPGIVLDVFAELRNASGTTLRAAVRSWDATARTVTVDVRDMAASGAVANPTTNDRIRLLVIARNSRA